MSMEIWLLIGIAGILVFMIVFYIINDREKQRRQEQWEHEVHVQYDRLQHKIDLLNTQLLNKLNEDIERLDENTQKRHNYLKKSFNDIADRLDLVEQIDKRNKDLYYQLERLHTTFGELIALMPKSVQPTNDHLESTSKNTPANKNITPEPVDEEVQKVLQYHRQGMSVEEIAQKLGRAIPEVQLALHIFTSQE